MTVKGAAPCQPSDNDNAPAGVQRRCLPVAGPAPPWPGPARPRPAARTSSCPVDVAPGRVGSGGGARGSPAVGPKGTRVTSHSALVQSAGASCAGCSQLRSRHGDENERNARGCGSRISQPVRLDFLQRRHPLREPFAACFVYIFLILYKNDRMSRSICNNTIFFFHFKVLAISDPCDIHTPSGSNGILQPS